MIFSGKLEVNQVLKSLKNTYRAVQFIFAVGLEFYYFLFILSKDFIDSLLEI